MNRRLFIKHFIDNLKRRLEENLEPEATENEHYEATFELIKRMTQ